jgi:hypothetical protein
VSRCGVRIPATGYARTAARWRRLGTGGVPCGPIDTSATGRVSDRASKEADLIRSEVTRSGGVAPLWGLIASSSYARTVGPARRSSRQTG